MIDEVEVAIVGGGAAGIAAARRMVDHGRSVLLIEALPRLGGRAHTIMAAGLPLDLGCGWLHSARRNAMVTVAEAQGVAVDRTESAWRSQFRDLGFPLADQRAAGVAYAAFEERLHDDPPASDRAGDAMRGDPWRSYADALSGYMNGAELDRLSVADFLAYDDAAGADNWRVPSGYGALFRGLGDRLPTVLNTPVAAIDHGGRSLRIETARGPLRAAAAIVAVSTAVLASGAIRFTPALDDHLQAAAGLPLGRADKLFLHMSEPDAVPPESHLLGDPRRAETGSYYLRPFGMPVIECFFGGLGARALEQAGDGAAEAFAREELGRLLGGGFARGLTPLARSNWGNEPTILGAYSHALPGHAADRAVLAAAPSPRLAFAGEACSPHDFSTAHGAWESGLRAADLIQAALDR